MHAISERLHKAGFMKESIDKASAPNGLRRDDAWSLVVNSGNHPGLEYCATRFLRYDIIRDNKIYIHSQMAFSTAHNLNQSTMTSCLALATHHLQQDKHHHQQIDDRSPKRHNGVSSDSNSSDDVAN